MSLIRLLTAAFLIVLCTAAQPLGYTTSAVVTIDHTKVPGANQANFPVMIARTDTTLKSVANGGKMTNINGYDILFTADAAGAAPLSYQRELHDTASGNAVYWVVLPSVSHTTDTPIYVWYGNSAVTTDQSKPASVWDSNYKAVWHLNDNAASTTVIDSTINRHNAANRANTSARAVAGILPNVTALSYNGPQDYTTATSPAGGDFDFTSGNFTYEFWLRINAFVVYGEYFGNGTWLKNGYYFQENGGGHLFMFASNHNSTWSGYQDSQVGTTGIWRHVAVVRQGTNLTTYVNGAVDKAATNFVSPASSSSPFTLGGSAGVAPHGMQGAIQEFRISNTNRSAGWIATEYANQSNPRAFFNQMVWGTPVSGDGGGAGGGTGGGGGGGTGGLPPTCSAGISQVFVVGQPATLDGTGSAPKDGRTTLTYLWQQIPSKAAGIPMKPLTFSSSTIVRPFLSGFSPGPLNFKLTVTQSDGQSSSCTVNDGAVATDSTGVVKVSTGNPTLDNAVQNLLGSMLPLGKNSWPFYDTANQNDANIQIGGMDTIYGDFWNNAGPGTVSVATNSYAVVGNGTTFTTTFCQGPTKPTLPRPGVGLIVWYPTNDGTGRFGRRLAGYPFGPGGAFIKSCTDNTHMTLAQNSWYASEAACPTGQTAPCGLQYSVWGTQPGYNVWTRGDAPANYYDGVSAYYALYYRSGLDMYLIAARKLADRFWGSPEIDLGNAFDPGFPLFGFQPQFRCWSIQGMVLRALDNSDGHADMWPGLHKVWNLMMTAWWLGNFPNNSKFGLDAREWGYGLAQLADCAMYDESQTYQQTCRNYIKNSFATSGPGALNIWPYRQGADGGWEQFFDRKASWNNQSTVRLAYGSTLVTCAVANCGWVSGDFPAPPQSYVWFTNSSTPPTSNSQGDPDPYCYQPGSSAHCTFIDSNHFRLDRPYDGPNCTSGCTRGWVFGAEGVAGWGQEPFFEGILAFAFDLAGRAMVCTSTNVPIGCDNPTATLAFQANTDAVNWIKKYGYRPTTNGFYYFTGFPGCQVPNISESNKWCTGGDKLASREYAADGFRGLIAYYQRTHDASMKVLLDNLYAGLWAKPGTNPIVPSPDGTYDVSFDTCSGCGFWLNTGQTQNKLFGQMFGWGALYSWPAVRLQ